MVNQVFKRKKITAASWVSTNDRYLEPTRLAER
jgi:hypothetical protein